MAKKLPWSERQQRSKYERRAKFAAKFHKFSFDATKKAQRGSLTGAQKAAITRAYDELKNERRLLKQKRTVFVAVKSDYRKRRAMETGTVVGRTNKGVFVSVNTGQIEKTGMGAVRVRVGRAGSVDISYGALKVRTVGIDKIAFAKNPVKLIRERFRQTRASSVSVVINGHESRGASASGIVESQQWEHYTNDLLRRIASDMQKADKRRTKESIRKHLSEHVAFRFYYGKTAVPKTETLAQSLARIKKNRVTPEDADDLEDISDE